jgi:hypothetical protein
MSDDEIRILNSNNIRKMHVDSVVSTTHLLKKAVMVPNDSALALNSNLDENFATAAPSQRRSQRQLDQPFMRGIMNFDDFNYKAFNPYVLIQEPENPSETINELEKRLSAKEKISNENNKLSEDQMSLVAQNTTPFLHEQTTLPPSKLGLTQEEIMELEGK